MPVIHLGGPPQVVSVGVGVHGTQARREVFELPDLWQLHLYGYQGALVAEEDVHELRPGRVGLIPPGTRVEYRYQGRSEHFFAHFRVASTGRSHEVPCVQDTGNQVQQLTGLFRHAVAAAASAPERTRAEIWAVLWRVVHLPRPEHPGERHPAVAAAAAYIEEHLARPLTVPEIARAAGVSHTHLTRLFHVATGCTVIAYLRRRRLQRAEHLLRETTLSITAIAACVGIADLQAFNKLCRRELGAGPRAVRDRTPFQHAARPDGPPDLI